VRACSIGSETQQYFVNANGWLTGWGFTPGSSLWHTRLLANRYLSTTSKCNSILITGAHSSASVKGSRGNTAKILVAARRERA
jgi:hypothetical protein